MRHLIFSALILASCSDRQPTGSNCPAGQVETVGGCSTLCSATSGCPSGTCCLDGVCTESATCAPVISSVEGTGSPDGAPGHSDRHVVDRLVIEGENLADAEILLAAAAGGASQALEPCQEPLGSLVVVSLPDALAAGEYTLTARNQAGQCVATVPLLRGEQGAQGDQGIQGVPGEQGEPGPAGSPDTADDILAKLDAVDGAGSGLDADTVQGLSPDAIMVPVGTIVPYIGDPTALPANWLPCDGRAISRTTYGTLFTAVGIRYGTGDGINTFNIPNLTDDRFLMGVPDGRLGESGGNNAITTDGSHTHSFTQTAQDLAPDASGNTSGSYTNPAGDHNHGGDKRPRYLGVVYAVRAR
jgi:hypothetical protein